MPKITVNLGENSYAIEIGKNLFEKIGKKVKEMSSAQKVAVITDDTVNTLYGEKLENLLKVEGFCVKRISFPAGEESKNLNVLSKVYSALAQFGLTRSDLIITLGGGVPGDLGGFAAATFLRGIDFIQIPTTLLAQIDSSVGGKVAVDLEEGKNLVGSFYQPKAVFIDPELLHSLPKRYLHDGLAEAIKYGCIRDLNLFNRLERISDDLELMEYIEGIIEDCCKIKAEIVEHDEYDLGERMLLNFGHTIGHAVEKCFNYAVYTHGEGVGIGMVRLSEETEKLGLTQAGTTFRIKNVLQNYGLPTEVNLEQKEIIDVIGLDKKKSGKSITLVVLEEIGKGKLIKVPFQDLKKYIV